VREEEGVRCTGAQLLKQQYQHPLPCQANCMQAVWQQPCPPPCCLKSTFRNNTPEGLQHLKKPPMLPSPHTWVSPVSTAKAAPLEDMQCRTSLRKALCDIYLVLLTKALPQGTRLPSAV
jgi:hypothetical protein